MGALPEAAGGEDGSREGEDGGEEDGGDGEGSEEGGEEVNFAVLQIRYMSARQPR